MTNPDNIVRVRARLDGRASVYEANGWAQAYSQGLLSGNGVLPNTIPDMNVLVGGTPSNPDVVIAENPDGYKIALDIVGQQAIAITAPASQSRISAIVAYTDDLSLASTDSTTTGSPSSCGLIVVNGSASANPTEPSDSTIRTAITSDGATGSQASYCVLATILVSSATTEISSSLITPKTATLAGSGIDFTTIAPTPGNILYTYTTPLSSTQNFTAPNAPCIITGKAVVLDSPGYACIYRGSQQSLSRLCCGIPYVEGQSNMQIAFEFFAKAGETFHVEVQNGQIENLTAYEVDWS